MIVTGRCAGQSQNTPRTVEAVTVTRCGRLAVAVAILLAGCATPQAVPQVVKVPYAVPCIESANVPVMPTTLPDADLAKQGDFELVITLATERIALRQYAKEAAAVITGCVKP